MNAEAVVRAQGTLRCAECAWAVAQAACVLVLLDLLCARGARGQRAAGLVQAWVGQIVTFFETAALAAPWAP